MGGTVEAEAGAVPAKVQVNRAPIEMRLAQALRDLIAKVETSFTASPTKFTVKMEFSNDVEGTGETYQDDLTSETPTEPKIEVANPVAASATV